jgi:hypothetical protein
VLVVVQQDKVDREHFWWWWWRVAATMSDLKGTEKDSSSSVVDLY